jgi:ribosomal subunit interface protein
MHIDLTEDAKALVNGKVQKLFNHDGKIIRISVSLAHDQNKSKNDAFVAHGKVEVDGRDLVARAASDDIYKSIDIMVNKLDRQLVDKVKLDNDRKKEVQIPEIMRGDIASTEVI